MDPFHAVVSIDHREARIFLLAKSGTESSHVHPADPQGHIHHKAGSLGSGHAHEDKHYLTAITDGLKTAHEILIVGHGEAKTTLAHFIRDHVPALAPRVVGVEALDHPSDGEIVAFAHKFFTKTDIMRPQL
jgi:stalled ribosome rescue protein Dom34